MKNKISHSIKSIALASSISLVSLLSLPAYAESGSVHHSGQASKHSVLAVAHGVGDSAKVASAVVAVPIIVAGGVSLAAGSTAVAIGESIGNGAQHLSSHHHRHATHTGPLKITEITITADPAPNQMGANTQTTQEDKTKSTSITTQTTKTELKKTTVVKEQR